MKLVASHDPGRWRAACRASEQPVTAFHTFAWLELAAGMTGTTFRPLVVTLRGEDVGVAPRLVRRRAVAGLVNWAPFPYLGPLVPAHLLGPTLDALRTHDLRDGVVRQQQSFPPAAQVDTAALRVRGFTLTRDPTYVVATSGSPDELWAALDSRCRTSIRKARRTGVVIEDAPDGTTLRATVAATFAGRGIPSGYRANFPPAAHALTSSGVAVHHVDATSGGLRLGSLMALAVGDRALMWQGGVLPQHRTTNANALLLWDAIGWAQRIGARSVDLVGVPDPAIGRFKSQFGGELTEFVVARRTSAPGRLIERVRRPRGAGAGSSTAGPQR